VAAGFKDHFSDGAEGYRASRPGYPAALFAFLAGEAPGRRCAWDCACGSGQASGALAAHFELVVATDASQAQVRLAPPVRGVGYVVATAERAPLRAGAADLVTVAQALHWFDLPGFFAEVRRVLRPGGVVAAWTYGLLRICAPVDACIDRLYAQLNPWWPAERAHVDAGYRTLPFPFAPLPSPGFDMTGRWGLEDLVGYLGTWSAMRRCRAQTGTDPLAGVRDELARAWGDPRAQREVTWPLVLRAGRHGPAAGSS